MKEIAKNSFYELNYNEAENIVYWKMKGFWKDMSVVPGFHKDWEKARKLTKTGWKIFSDASECKVIPPDVNTEKIKNQEKAIESGCTKIALVVNSAITTISIMRGTQESGAEDRMKVFGSEEIEKAKQWLKS
ncbi:MAG TPA: hypothetical protein P5120_11560 [Spirochaetota bacterium]|nr:hypothetical protein [Spirochaetota bacterium]HPF06475.1 hypothetical protein [Spirochaetota bacterium]HPJ42755.1 hypothetical protein [Spirochaetota bacterium]HRX48147.1 hypothetical protein [Spirochaetota bacterium]